MSESKVKFDIDSFKGDIDQLSSKICEMAKSFIDLQQEMENKLNVDELIEAIEKAERVKENEE